MFNLEEPKQFRIEEHAVLINNDTLEAIQEAVSEIRKVYRDAGASQIFIDIFTVEDRYMQDEDSKAIGEVRFYRQVQNENYYEKLMEYSLAKSKFLSEELEEKIKKKLADYTASHSRAEWKKKSRAARLALHPLGNKSCVDTKTKGEWLVDRVKELGLHDVDLPETHRPNKRD